jgi:sodium-dependent dicarboxylate transporter 2/3/5
VLLLLGGGLAIAESFSATGLSGALGNLLRPLIGTLSPFLLVLVVCTFVTFLTEVSSNTAVTSILLPVLAKAAVQAGVDPRLVMVPATVAASFAFMMPVATPPNAIVFGSGLVSMRSMVSVGFWVNLLGILVLTLVLWTVSLPLLGVDPGSVPDWARPR